MEVVTRDKFASPTQEAHVLPQGLTIDEMLVSVEWNNDLRPWTYVSVDGQEIPAQIWNATRPKEGRKVLIALRPAGGGGGGGGGKQVLMAVASIAILVVAAVVAPYLVPLLGYTVGMAGYGTALAITTGVLAVAGSLALGALIRPGSLGRQALGNTGSGGNSPEESATYGVNGAQNTLSPYGVVPRIYGRHRVTPPFAAEPYIVSAGTSQTINLLLDFGYGPLLVQDLRIGNTPIQNFPTARWFIHANYKSGDPLYIYQNDQATQQVGAVLVEVVDNVRTVPQAASVITMEFQFPNGLVTFNDQGQSFQKDDHITIFARPQSGAGGWQPISNFQPYALFQGEGGTQNSGAAQTGSIGVVRWSRGSITGYPQGFTTSDPVANSMQIGTLFTYNGVGYTISGRSTAPDGDTVVELAGLPPNISWIYNHTGIIVGEEGRAGSFPLPGSQGASGPLWVTFGPSSYDVEFHGQTRTPRTVSVVMQMPYEDEWDVLIRRSTPVSQNALTANTIIWSTLRAGRWSLPIYPRAGRTIMELQVTASEQISGQIQNINALCTSLLWDPRQNAVVPNRNPAWIYADILTGTANPRAVGWDKLDVAKLTEFANKCGALVVQGDRFATCDMVVDFRSTIGELAQTVCSAGRAAPTVVDGLYSVLLENETRVPVQMFTNRNANNFSASRTWVDFPHALKVRYLSEITWNREEMTVYADGYDALNASKFENLDLMGVVRPPQVWRFGRYFLAAALLRRERMTLQTDVENLVCQRGDLVLIAHDRLLANFVARARDINGGVITMDGYLTTELFSVPWPRHPANAGTTLWPTNWGNTGQANANVTVNWGAKGTDGEGREWVEVTLLKAAAGGTTNFVQIIPGPVYYEVNANDTVAGSWELEVLELNNMVGDSLTLNFQPFNSTGGTGLGSPNQVHPFPPVGERTVISQALDIGNAIGVINGWRPNLSFAWAATTDHPASMKVKLYTPQFWTNNPLPSMLARVNEVGNNLLENSEAAGAVLGVLTSSGTNGLPTGWFHAQWSGWTLREIVRVSDVWDYHDFDIRVQAPAGTAAMSIVFGPAQDLPASKIVTGSVQLRRVATVGTAPTVNLRTTALTAAGGFVQNSTGGNLTLSTTNENRHSHGPSNFSALPTAERFQFAVTFTPAAGVACDATFRIRLPLLGATDPATGIPTVPPPEAIYGQLRDGDGVIVDSFPIIGRPAEDQILVAGDIAARASLENVIAIGGLETETSPWLVDKITPGPDFAANMEFIEYAPEILDADKGPIPPYVPAEGSGLLVDLPPVRNLMLSSTLFVYTSDGIPTHTILLQWDPPAFQVAFYIVSRLYVVLDPGVGTSRPYQNENVLQEIARVQRPDFVDTIDTRTLRLEGTTIRYFVTPVAASGRRGETRDVETILFPDVTAPPEVQFTTNVLSETTMLIWERPDIPDLGGYQVRFIDQTWADVNPLWEDMVSAVDSIGPELTSLTVHIQTGIYAIRAYDTSGNFGPPSYSLTKVETLPNVDEVTRLTEGPTWAGTFDRTELVGNELRLTKNAQGNYNSSGWFYPTSAVTYEDSWLFRVRGAFQSYAFPTLTDPRGDWNVQIWVAIQREAPKLNSAWFTPLVTADPLAGGVGVYVPLGNVAQTDLIGRLINWAVRLTSRRGTLTPSVKRATLIVDHSERREFGNDRATGTGGLNIVFKKPFFAPPTAAVTLNDGQSGDRIVKTTSTTALTVEVFNSAGASVNRRIDWQVVGYGRGI